MRRRTLLKALSALPFVGTASASTSAPAFQDVVVVGGGPAGVSAALELAERGVRVTLVEAGSRLGGKASGWVENHDGEPVDVEHGIHGWWYQYVHFHDLLARYGLAENLREFSAGENGIRQPDNAISGLPERLKLLASRAKEKGHEKFPVAYRKGTKWLKKQRASALRLELSGRSVADWATRRNPLTTWSALDGIFAQSMYFVGPEHVDAAEYVEGERFYFQGKNGEVQWLKGNPDTLIWKPLEAALRGLGGRVLVGERVEGLVRSGGRVVGVRLGRPRAELEVEGPFDSWQAIEVGGDKVWLGPPAEDAEDDVPVAYSARCTHQGCPVDATDDGFACPCHGGRYDAKGSPIAGPPEHPLTPLKVSWSDRRKKKVKVVRPTRQRTVGAKWVVLAVDVPAATKLAGELLPGLQELRATREVVARFWLDKDVAPGARSAVLLDGFAHGSNAFLVHRLQQNASKWKGSVIELQAYKGWTGEETKEQLLKECIDELYRCWPELDGMKVVKQHLTVGDRFTWFAPGWRQHAPRVRCGVEGLLMAGDFIDVPNSEAQFMERSVMTGRMAANVALLDLGKQPAAMLQPR